MAWTTARKKSSSCSRPVIGIMMGSLTERSSKKQWKRSLVDCRMRNSIDELFKAVDKDGSGHITYDEFFEFLHHF